MQRAWQVHTTCARSPHLGNALVDGAEGPPVRDVREDRGERADGFLRLFRRDFAREPVGATAHGRAVRVPLFTS